MTHPLKCLVIIASLASCNPVQSDATAIYQDARSPGRWDARSQIVRHFPVPDVVPRFIIVGGNLFLLTQLTRERALATEVIEQPEWNASDLSTLEARHPELRGSLRHLSWAKAG